MMNHSDEQDRPETMTNWLGMIDQLRSTLAHDGEPAIEMIQTHISVVLLGKQVALKLKKPVDFGFLDYTTLEKRRIACHAEVALNSRLSPDVYLGVQPVVERDGVLHLHGKGRIVDYAVLMKRLPAAHMLDQLVANNSVSEAIISRIAARLAQFHRQARRGADVDQFGSIDVIRGNWQENFDQMMPYVGRTINRQEFDSIRRWVTTWLDDHEELLKSRVAQGFICDGHGDVRCESICVEGDRPDGISIFDCIEFNDRFRCGDVAGEVAFLATDLDARGRPDLGYFFTEEYSRQSGDTQLFSLLPFYRCYRAFVRGKVLSFRLDESEFSKAELDDASARARNFFDLAARYAAPMRTPAVIAVMGLSGTGKSSLARALAGELGWRVVSSDIVRAEIFGDKKRPAAYGQESYSDEANRMTYQALVQAGQKCLQDDGGVILDATFLRPEQRAAACEMARNNGAQWRLIVCNAPLEVVRTRLSQRQARGDSVSDADWNIYLEQSKKLAPLAGGHADGRIILDTREQLSSIARSAAYWLRADQTSRAATSDSLVCHPPYNPPFSGWPPASKLSESELLRRK